MKFPEFRGAVTLRVALTGLATAATLINANKSAFNDKPHGKEIVAVAAGVGAVLSALGVSDTTAV